MKKIKSVFWGTPEISVHFLEKTKKLGFYFDLIITNPDRPTGRKKALTSSAVKKWAEKNSVNILQPEKIDDNFIEKLKKEEWDFFFVLAYGKILPKSILEIPRLGVLNLHPSLLPKYRGPSPIMSAILDDQKETGVSIIKLDEGMDSGPILSQEKVFVQEWEKNEEMEKKFAEIGATNFLEILSDFILGKITQKNQEDSEKTFCQKYQKKDMELFFPFDKKNARKNFLRYCASPKPFYFDQNLKRNIVTDAEWKSSNFVVKKIIPEGKNEREF
jgi:methionyl-tRNA formyltransferase